MSPPRALRLVVATMTLSFALTACSDTEPATSPTESSPTSSTGDTVTPSTAPADDVARTSAAATTEATGEAAQTTAAPAGVSSADGSFTLTLPEGWADASQEVSSDIEAAIKSATMRDDFYDNIVVVSQQPMDDLQTSIKAAAREIAGENGSYQMLDRIRIGGDTAYGYSLSRTKKGVEIAQTQWWVQHADRLYVVTLSSAKSQEQQAKKVFEQVLSTWTWEG